MALGGPGSNPPKESVAYQRGEGHIYGIHAEGCKATVLEHDALKQKTHKDCGEGLPS